MIHRVFLATSIAFVSLIFSPLAQAQFQPSQRYPDPLVRIIDPSFTKYRLPLAKLEKIAAGMRGDAVERGAGLVWGWAVSAVERYSE